MKAFLILSAVFISLLNHSAYAATGQIELHIQESEIACSNTTLLIQNFRFIDQPQLQHRVFSTSFDTDNGCYRALFRILDNLPSKVTETYTSQIVTKTGIRQRGNCSGPHGCWDEEYQYDNESISFDLDGNTFTSILPIK